MMKKQRRAGIGGTLSVRGCKKAADFVNFCDAFNIPVVTLTNVTGFEASKCSENRLQEKRQN